METEGKQSRLLAQLMLKLNQIDDMNAEKTCRGVSRGYVKGQQKIHSHMQEKQWLIATGEL